MQHLDDVEQDILFTQVQNHHHQQQQQEKWPITSQSKAATQPLEKHVYIQ